MTAIAAGPAPDTASEFFALPHNNAMPDPLGADMSSDEVVVTTRRGMVRVALVATEVAARFQREGIRYDPMAWMLAPRRLFAGSTAIEACLGREDCLRAILLHGLSIGLDADVDAIDSLTCDEAADSPEMPWRSPKGSRDSVGDGYRARLRLYTAVFLIARGGEVLSVFHASVAPSAAVVRERIRARFGTAAADACELRLGVDLKCPLTKSLMPPSFLDLVQNGGRRSRWSALARLDLTVEQRVPS